MIPGFSERMRNVSVLFVPTAILSRKTAGIIVTKMILNISRFQFETTESIDDVFKTILHAVLFACAEMNLHLHTKYHMKIQDSKECTFLHCCACLYKHMVYIIFRLAFHAPVYFAFEKSSPSIYVRFSISLRLAHIHDLIFIFIFLLQFLFLS